MILNDHFQVFLRQVSLRGVSLRLWAKVSFGFPRVSLRNQTNLKDAVKMPHLWMYTSLRFRLITTVVNDCGQKRLSNYLYPRWMILSNSVSDWYISRDEHTDSTTAISITTTEMTSKQPIPSYEPKHMIRVLKIRTETINSEFQIEKFKITHW